MEVVQFKEEPFAKKHSKIIWIIYHVHHKIATMMKKYLILFFLPCSLSFAFTEAEFSAKMQNDQHLFVKQIPKKHVVLHKDSTFSIFPSYQRFALNANGIGEFHGNIWGGGLSYEFSRQQGIYAHLSVQGSAGTLNSQVGNSTIGEIEFLFSERLGYNFLWGKERLHTFTPYVGYQYLWWRQHLAITGYSLFRYTYQKPYIPFGFILDFYITKRLSVGIHYAFLFDINTYVNIDQLIGANWFLKRQNDQLVEFPLRLQVKDFLSLSLIPFYRSVKMGESTAVTSTGLSLGLEEENYQIWGANFALSYTF